MPNEIPLPPDLNYLIEKREEKEDRRESDRRQMQNDRTPGLPAETAEAEADSDRRASDDNRQRARRDGDESK